MLCAVLSPAQPLCKRTDRVALLSVLLGLLAALTAPCCCGPVSLLPAVGGMALAAAVLRSDQHEDFPTAKLGLLFSSLGICIAVAHMLLLLAVSLGIGLAAPMVGAGTLFPASF